MSSARVLSARLTVGCGIRRIDAATVTCSVSATVDEDRQQPQDPLQIHHFHALTVYVDAETCICALGRASLASSQVTEATIELRSDHGPAWDGYRAATPAYRRC